MYGQKSLLRILLPLITLIVATIYATARPADTTDVEKVQAAEAAPTDTLAENTFVVEIRHRMHPNFRQVDTVAVDEAFYVGEEEWEVRIVTFNPHLGITTKGERLVMSDTLYNPAIEVEVRVDDSLTQTSWGFYFVDAPHFYREDMLGFKIIDFNVGPEYIQPPDRK